MEPSQREAVGGDGSLLILGEKIGWALTWTRGEGRGGVVRGCGGRGASNEEKRRRMECV